MGNQQLTSYQEFKRDARRVIGIVLVIAAVILASALAWRVWTATHPDACTEARNTAMDQGATYQQAVAQTLDSCDDDAADFVRTMEAYIDAPP